MKNNNFLIVLLIVISLFAGYLYAKVQTAEKTQNTTVQQGAAQGTPVPAKVDVGSGHLPLKGNKNSKVKIVEFADFRCPFCERFYTTVEQQLLKDYVDTGKVSFSFRHYAFLGPASVLAANASECANEQGKFWDFYDYLYKNQPAETDISMYTNDNFSSTAGNMGMDSSKFKSCLDSNKYDKKVSSDLSDGQKAGVNGTPTVFVNGVPIVGAQPYDVFKRAIDQELAKN